MKRGPRRTSEPQLMGAAEAATALGVRQQNLRRQVGLPEPYQHIRATTLWRATDIWEFVGVRAARDTETARAKAVRTLREASDEPAAAAA